MKTQTNNKSRIPEILLTFVAAAGLGLWLSGCNPQTNNSPAGLSPLACVNNSCPGITASPADLISAQGASNSQYGMINVAFDFVGVSTQFSTYNVYAYANYSGPIAFAGYFQISAAQGVGVTSAPNGTSNACGAPFGTYTLQATSQGTFTNGTFNGGTLAGTGPGGVPIILTMGQGQLYNATDSTGIAKNAPNNRMNAAMVLNTVNGVTCGLQILLQ